MPAGLCPLPCDDGDACTLDRCDAERGCVHDEQLAAGPEGVFCVVGNLHDQLSDDLPAAARRIARVANLIDRAGTARRSGRCRAMLRAAVQTARALERDLARTAFLPPGLTREARRLRERTGVLAKTACTPQPGSAGRRAGRGDAQAVAPPR
jgi:hypothetical protein